MPPFSKQSSEPTFPDLLWSRPVTKATAGRLLIIGGHSKNFSQIQAVYQTALAAGAGECRVVVPTSLQPVLAGAPDTYFVPASSAGGLGKAAENAILQLADGAQGVILGPSLGHTSEGSILAEALVARLTCPLLVVSDGLAALQHGLGATLQQPNVTIVATMPELFKLAGVIDVAIGIKPDEGVLNKIRIVQTIAAAGLASYLLADRDMIVMAGQKTSLTTAVSSMEFFLPATYGVAAVFVMQQPQKRFEALTTAAYVLARARQQVAGGEANQPLLLDDICRAIRRASQDNS